MQFDIDDVKKPQRFAGAQVGVLVWLMSSYFATTLMYTHVSSTLTGSSLMPPFRTMAEFVQSDFSPLLMSSGNSEIEFMNTSALRPLLLRIRRSDYTPPFDTRIQLAAELSQTQKLAVFITDEKPLFQKAGFIRAVDSAYDTFISVYQMPLASETEPQISHVMKWMAATGTLKSVAIQHKAMLYRAHGIPYTVPGDQTIPTHDAAIRMEALVSMCFIGVSIFSAAGLLFLLEIILVSDRLL
ncbi:uncharacterized protein LOC129591329 [Paramacrobiotus metropolitanus]|uniref:uncharacterized protein LOC129591329 n=1 Tax=Paramacrobiotus metropolitanus TaxID=2943436 RepID=UPI002445B206|nr:uncharacterized protein LOC129591329 [Paramacrobiotus metropolitanus]